MKNVDFRDAAEEEVVDQIASTKRLDPKEEMFQNQNRNWSQIH